MNRIFSLVWDPKRGMMVVASEFAQSKGKGKGARLLQAVALAGAAAVVMPTALATGTCSVTGGGPAPVAIGTNAFTCGSDGARADERLKLGAHDGDAGIVRERVQHAEAGVVPGSLVFLAGIAQPDEDAVERAAVFFKKHEVSVYPECRRNSCG